MEDTHPSPTVRRVLQVAGLLVLAAYAWLAVTVYRTKADPEHYQAWNGSNAWRIGPSGKDLKEAADARMKSALAAVRNQDYDAYREHLPVAKDLLERSLRAQPRQAEVLARLAAVEWELEPSFTDEGVARYLAMVQDASAMAPNSPIVQFRLGNLLLAMGRRDEAAPYLVRAVDLNPGQTRQVAEALLGQGYAPADLIGMLPDEAGVLAGLGRYFKTRDDGGEKYLSACEAILDDGSDITGQLLYWYSIVGRRLREFQRLYDHLAPLSFSRDLELEAERLVAASRALSGQGREEEAVAQATAATRLEPELAQYQDALGDAALAAGDFDLARKAYRDGIGLLARQGKATGYRSLLYRKIGQVEEKAGRPDKAYDAYRIALELNPEEWFAGRRMKQMREAAGIGLKGEEEE